MANICKCGCGTEIKNDRWEYARGHKPGGATQPHKPRALARREPEIVIEAPPEGSIAVEVPVRMFGRIFGLLTPYQRAVALATGMDADEVQPDE